MRRFFIVLALLLPLCIAQSASAAYMSPISDLIGNSQPSVGTPHIITFTVTNAIPASGAITITPESAFSIPAGFDFNDVDVAVSNGGPYVERDLAASASGAADGVSVVSGAAGSIAITLSSGSGIAGNSSVRVILGTNATHQVTGDTNPINPASPGSYRIRVETDNGGTPIDIAKAMIVVVLPVGLSTVVNDNAPQISNALPTGTVPGGSNKIEISFQTNVMATCRYATTTGVAYAAMTHTFSSVGQQLHYTVISGHIDGATYDYFIRCRDTFGATAQSDYDLSFTLAPTPTILTSDGNTPGVPSSGPAGSAGSGGVGSFAGGSALLFLSTVTISGQAPANSSVAILKDGKQEIVKQAGSDGSFSATIPGLERGTYTFVSFATDAKSLKTSRFSSTITLNSGTNNGISGVLLSPTVAPETATVNIGDDVHISGIGIPGTTVGIVVSDVPTSGQAGVSKEYTASSTADGTWNFTIAARDLKRGTYGVKVKTVTPTASSELSASAFFGYGEDPSQKADTGNRSDINKDGKVNLVDFSILLTNWNGSDADADINEDGTVNIADFSILLFNWTG